MLYQVPDRLKEEQVSLYINRIKSLLYSRNNHYNMKIGTHNSMSYLPPKKWYLYPFRFMAKCQSRDIEEQYKMGARMFDIRISYDEYGVAEFRHGSMAFEGNIYSVLGYLNSMPDDIYVRLILEVKNTKDLCRQEHLFKLDCEFFESRYNHIIFFCGRRKFDWKQLYKFKADDIELTQKISSMVGTKIDDLWPWIYARIFNRKNFNRRNKDKWLLLDFIEYTVE